MKTNILILAFLIGVTAGGCHKDEIDLYSDSDYLYFGLPSTDSTTLSFFFHPGHSTVDMPVEVRLIGKPAETDRYFSLSVDTKETTLPAANYTLPEKPVFRAGHAIDTIYITVKNYAALKTSYQFLRLRIEPGEQFGTGPVTNLSALISVTDQASKPAWWDPNNYVETYGEENYELGRFTVKKYSLFIQVTGVIDMGPLSYDEQLAAMKKFKYYLTEQKEQGHEVMEDDGIPMKLYVMG